MSTSDLESRALERAMRAGQATTTSEPVRRAALRAVQDGLSVALAGVTEPELAAFRESLTVPTRGAGPGSGRVSLWFGGEYLPAGQAAMLNGAAIHAYDFDDTHDAAIVHSMAAVLPAAVAGAELSDGGGPELLAAVAAGTELACNLAMARGHYAGWHYTTLCGTLGAALACALGLGADPPGLAEAVGNAYVYAAGNKQAVLDSSLMKRLMPGFAAHNGVLAAQAAAAGLGGVTNWLSGEFGLLQLFYDNDFREAHLAGGDRFRIEELSYKPFPACRFTHGAIECALRLRQRLGPDVARAASTIEVHYPDLDRFGIVCRPYQRRGAGVMDAQFSTAYLVAAALLRGSISFESYTPAALDDAEVQTLAATVTIACDLLPAAEDQIGPIEVRIDGQAEQVATVLGSPERPLAAGDIAGKFETCLARYRSHGPAATFDGGWEWLEGKTRRLEEGTLNARGLAASLSLATS